MAVNRSVWITGAGSGIGKALAIGYAQKGYDIVLSGRKVETLEDVASICANFGVKTLVAPHDLTQVQELSRLLDFVRSHFSKIDILINNGGVSQRSLIAETPLDVDRKIFEVNFFGTIAFTKAILPWMVETGGGVVAVVSSISGLFGFPLRSSYAATKHALSGYFETIGLEYSKAGIHTTIIYPGRIQTEISMHAITSTGAPQNTMDRGLRKGMDVDKCAKKIIRGIERKKRKILVGKGELTLAWIHKYLPFLFWKIAVKIDPR